MLPRLPLRPARRPDGRPGPTASGRVRPWDRLRLPAPPDDPSALTGHPVRTPTRADVPIADPASGATTSVAVFTCEPVPDATPVPAARGSAPPADLVFVHGFRGDHHGLALLADCLPEHRVHSVELPGFGSSPAFPDAEHTVAHHADALRQVLAVVATGSTGGSVRDRTGDTAPDPAPPVVVAHSYGTVVAAHAVAADAHRAVGSAVGRAAARLALLNPIAEPVLDASASLGARALALLARAYYALAAAVPERAGRAVLGAPPVVWATTIAMSGTSDRTVLGYTHDQHRRHFSSFASAAMLAESYRASSAGTVLEVAASLPLPVLLIAGAEDPLGSVPAQEHLAAAVAAGGGTPELHVLADVGHLLHYERPVECAALIRDWLAR